MNKNYTVKVDDIILPEAALERIRQIVREEIAASHPSLREVRIQLDGKEIAKAATPKKVYDLRPVVKEMLSILVKHEILMSSLDRVLDELRKAALTSTRIQEIWANDDYQGYREL
mgnify:CR=1 FL=1